MSDRRETLTAYYQTWADDGNAEPWVRAIIDLLEGEPCTP